MNERLKHIAKLASFLAVTLATAIPQVSMAHGGRWAHQHHHTQRHVEVCKHFHNFTRCRLVPRAALRFHGRLNEHTHGFYRNRSLRHGVTVIKPMRPSPIAKTVPPKNRVTRPTIVGQAVKSRRRAATRQIIEKHTPARASKACHDVRPLTPAQRAALRRLMNRERAERQLDEGSDL